MGVDISAIGTRRKARVVVLQALYEMDCSAHKLEEILARLSREKALPEEAVDFAHELATGILHDKQKIDDAIRRLAPVFPLEQIAAVDRNILRLAIFEILFDNNKVPIKVAVNEAVEMAKAFGSDVSPKFINGVLGSVVGEVICGGKV